MRRAVMAVAFVFLLTVSTSAADSVGDFSFQTVEGNIIAYKAGGGNIMVVNIGSHW